jgi:hypothetical protein
MVCYSKLRSIEIKMNKYRNKQKTTYEKLRNIANQRNSIKKKQKNNFRLKL